MKIATRFLLLAAPGAMLAPVFAQAPSAPAAPVQAQAQTQAQAQINTPDGLTRQLLAIKRVYVDRLTGGETAAQMRDLIITSLQNSRLFVVTENPDRADAVLRGAAEDLIYTDNFISSDNLDVHAGAGSGTRSNRTTYSTGGSNSHSINLGAGEDESENIKERKHEAMATVRLVDKDGDVIWSATEESNGAKFHGASADVASKIARDLSNEYERLRKAPGPLVPR
jgi:hypothetical protein